MVERRFTILVAGLAGALVAASIADAAPNPADLLVYYKFDETSGTTVHDQTGSYDGSINISNAWHPGGKYGGCIQCGDNHAEVTVPTSLFSQLSSEVTVCVWIRGDTEVPNVYEKVFGGRAPWYEWWLYAHIPFGEGHRLGIVEFGAGGDWDSSPNQAVRWHPSGSGHYYNNWNHYIFTKSTSTGGGVKIYHNGSEKAHNSEALNSVAGISKFVIGKQPDDEEYYSGRIDEFAIFEKRLAGDDITTLYTQGPGAWLPGPTPPIIEGVSPDPDSAIANSEYTRQLTLSQGTAPITWSVVQGPTGLTVDANGYVSGWTPATEDIGNSFTIAIEAGNAYGSDTESWQVEVVSGEETVALHDIFEISITNNTPYSNKFRDVNLDATFVSPSSREVDFTGFFDGDGSGGGEHLDVTSFPQDNAGELTGNVWKLRFMPDEPGAWTYSWSFSDGSKAGSGGFCCVAEGARPGVIKNQSGSPFWHEDGQGRPFFPKPVYILPGEQLCYSTSVYGPNVYDKLTQHGFNLIVGNYLPIWNWTTNQVHPSNGYADTNIMLYYQHSNYSGDESCYDTDRMNLFTWKRLEDHLSYLADRGVVTWGFQGFAIKRTLTIRPNEWPADKGRWYIRYCMARMAPYWNVIWNHTWESDSGADNFKAWINDYDPWDHHYFQVDSAHSRYDICACDSTPDGIPSYYGTGRPIWMCEDNGPLWGYNRSTHGSDNVNAMDMAWKLVCQGATAYWSEWDYDTSGGRPWSQVDTADVVDYMDIVYNFIGDQTSFAGLRPHRELVDSGAYCLADPGQEYVVYSASGSSFNLNLSAAAGETLDCRFLNPADGSFQPTFQRTGGGTEAFTKPNSGKWALHVVKVVEPDPPVIEEVTPDPDTALIGIEYTKQLTLSQGTPPITWSAVQGPSGIQVDAGGMVSGWTPDIGEVGSLLAIEIEASNAAGSDSESWQVRVKVRADFDGDGDVDQEDFGHLQVCLGGSGVPCEPGCQAADLDSDTDVDLSDFSIFQGCLSGPNIPADPGCAD